MSFPDFFDQAPVIQLRDPLAELLGSATDGVMDYCYADVVRLAGHSCPTVAGAFLTTHAALQVLYAGEMPERGAIKVHMPGPESVGTTGVVAQVITLVTGAAAKGGFKGIGVRLTRRDLMSFAQAEMENDGLIRFERTDSGAAVLVKFDGHAVPADHSQKERMQAVMHHSETPEQQKEFAHLWQERVRKILIEHADDPALLTLVRLDSH